MDEIYYGMTQQAEAALYNNVLARQALLKAGLPPETVSLTVDRACCSSIASAILAYRTIKADEGEVSEKILGAIKTQAEGNIVLGMRREKKDRFRLLVLLSLLFLTLSLAVKAVRWRNLL